MKENKKRFMFLHALNQYSLGLRHSIQTGDHIAKAIFHKPSEDCPNYEVCPVNMMIALRRETSRFLRVVSIIVTVTKVCFILWDGTGSAYE